jgi:hypothetical protein
MQTVMVMGQVRPVACGVINNTDCDGADATIYPGAPELCDGKDNNCNGEIDEGVKTTWYLDADADGYGTDFSVLSCSALAGYVAIAGDCNDHDAGIHPGAPEICDGVDNDCDGQVDEGFPDITYYRDGDGDGYGNDGETTVAKCAVPEGYVAIGGDCSDHDASIHPNAVEICDGIDNNCDGQIDEGFADVTYYRDTDGDGYGNDAGTTTAKCAVPEGYVAIGGDCNDHNASIHPNAVEICDGIDNNCDGQIDEGFADVTYYKDADGDGYGNDAQTTTAKCNTPTGYVAIAGDCNDNDASIYPNAVEICDGIDNNCDGQVDEGIASVSFYFDNDHDGYGGQFAFLAPPCGTHSGYSTGSGDCDDLDNSVHPGATELCDGKDNNCNGVIDEGFTPITYYRDADHDGYGDATHSTTASCSVPPGYVTNSGDCNDSDPFIHQPMTYYTDADGDGYGAGPGLMLCASIPPKGFSTNNTDCNDNDQFVHQPITYYTDADGDGYGTGQGTQFCTSNPPKGYSTNNTDCNDNDGSVNQAIAYYVDADGDGYGAGQATLMCTFTPPKGYVNNNTDCNDNDPAIHQSVMYYIDADGDGFGGTNGSLFCLSLHLPVIAVTIQIAMITTRQNNAAYSQMQFHSAPIRAAAATS